MKRLTAVLSLAAALALGPAAVGATSVPPNDTADYQSPALDLLGLVPLSPELAGDLVGITDLAAAIDSRPGAPRFESWSEFDASPVESASLWLAAIANVDSGVYRYLLDSERTPELVGFDMFEIDRVLKFGTPPNAATVFAGEFDLAAVEAALTAREYVGEERGEAMLYCGPVGCAQGHAANAATQDVANPFGGDLGRDQPVLAADGVLASSTNGKVVEAMAAVLGGEAESYLDVTFVAAAANVLDAQGAVVHAMFAPPTMFSADPAEILGPHARPEAIEVLRERFAEDFGVLPLYGMAFLGAATSDDRELTLVGLSFATEADAREALPVLEQRFESYVSVVVNQPLVDLLAARELTVEGWDVYADDATGHGVVMLTLGRDVPSSEPADDLVWSHQGIRLLSQMLAERDLAWLAPGAP